MANDGATQGEATEGNPAESNMPPRGLKGLRVAFLGKMGGLSKRAAARLVREHGGHASERCQLPLDLLVLGADEVILDPAQSLDPTLRAAVDRGELQIISETQFWQRLGLVDHDGLVRRLHTPAMLAQLLQVPIAIIRRWHRRGLIVPICEIHRLPYFDFQEVATARRLAELLAAGDSPGTIERKLAKLARYLPDVERPLAQLSVIVEGRQLLLRQGEGLIEPSGQRRLDFEAANWRDADAETASEAMASSASAPTLSLDQLLSHAKHTDSPSRDELVTAARACEDEGQWRHAVEFYRAALLAGGPQPILCFQLAEVLYQLDDLAAARERYAMCLELDEDYVEARANLGCVLSQMGDKELAVAAFRGALASHPDYADAHYHLARLLDDLGQDAEATHHWERFVVLASDSPWADEARDRLGWSNDDDFDDETSDDA